MRVMSEAELEALAKAQSAGMRAVSVEEILRRQGYAGYANHQALTMCSQPLQNARPDSPPPKPTHWQRFRRWIGLDPAKPAG